MPSARLSAQPTLTSSGRPKSDGDQPAIRLHRRTDRSDHRLP
jgi:hypothetical protein